MDGTISMRPADCPDWSLLLYGTLGDAVHPPACTHVGAIPSGYGMGWNRGKRHCWLSEDIVCVSCLTGGWLPSNSSIKHNTAYTPRTNIGGPRYNYDQ